MMMQIGLAAVFTAGWYLLGWIHGRMFERDHGDRKCGARPEGDLTEERPDAPASGATQGSLL